MPAREAETVIVGAVGEAGRLERRVDAAARVEAVQRGEEREVLARRQLGVEVQLVGEQADPAPKRRRRARAPAARRSERRRCVGADQRGEHADQRRLAGAVRAEQADDLAGAERQRDVRQRAAPAEMARDVGQLDGVEIESTSVTTRGEPCAAGRLGARVVGCRGRRRRARARRRSPRGARA